jgi:hypothetical protein
MNEMMYRYEISASTLDYLLKVLGTRPHDEVRSVYDQLVRGKIEQDQEQRERPVVPSGNGQFQELNSPG